MALPPMVMVPVPPVIWPVPPNVKMMPPVVRLPPVMVATAVEGGSLHIRNALVTFTTPPVWLYVALPLSPRAMVPVMASAPLLMLTAPGWPLFWPTYRA